MNLGLRYDRYRVFLRSRSVRPAASRWRRAASRRWTTSRPSTTWRRASGCPRPRGQRAHAAEGQLRPLLLQSRRDPRRLGQPQHVDAVHAVRLDGPQRRQAVAGRRAGNDSSSSSAAPPASRSIRTCAIPHRRVVGLDRARPGRRDRRACRLRMEDGPRRLPAVQPEPAALGLQRPHHGGRSRRGRHPRHGRRSQRQHDEPEPQPPCRRRS